MRVALKLTTALVAGIVLVQAGSVAVRIRRERELFIEDIARDSRVLGRTLGHAVEQTWESSGEAATRELVDHATQQESHLHIRLVWLDWPTDESDEPAAALSRLEPLRRGQSVVLQHGEPESSVLTYVPVRLSPDRLGAIEIVDPLADEEQYLARSTQNEWLTALVLVAVSGLLAWLLGYWLIGLPVDRLVAQARAVARGDFGRRNATRARDEIGVLGAEMDAMSESLEKATQELAEETQSRITAIEHLRHADRLTTIGTLAAGIAHQLGTPINVIGGHAQIIREDETAGSSVKRNAEAIASQCSKMAQIISGVLDFARQGGSWGSSARVRQVAEESLKMMAPIAKTHDIELRFEDHASEATTRIAPNHLQQVLSNILVNAVQAMPAGGDLRLRIDRLRARRPGADDAEREYVAVAVEDTGVGMDAETAERVFEPFFTTKEVGEGTGLGLSVAYGIVEDHGGWIQLHTAPGQGSTFTVFLPSTQ